MNQPFQFVSPDRLLIREGGGCLSLFGLPFFAAGVFLLLSCAGVIPVSNAGEVPALGWALLAMMGIAFTAVGGALAFGRSWTTIDRSQRIMIKQWGLLVPLRQRLVPLHGYTTIGLGFIEGDSETADRFPVALKTQSGPDAALCTFTEYGRARDCARIVAQHLQLEVEDASTDHPVRLPAAQMDEPFRERMRRVGAPHIAVERPPNARTQVHSDQGEVIMAVPSRRMPAVLLAAGLIPAAIALNAFLRSRRGRTIVAVSRQGLRIQERGAWTTRTIASLDASDILDVDYSSCESSIASARRAAEQQVLQSHPSSDLTMGPRVERLVGALSRFGHGRGVTVKTRRGLTTFGQGLDDAEIRYVHAVVRKALIE